jgi:hypothetical protein
VIAALGERPGPAANQQLMGDGFSPEEYRAADLIARCAGLRCGLRRVMTAERAANAQAQLSGHVRACSAAAR